eukprot:1190106-Pyramimonas_sp.AAC.1
MLQNISSSQKSAALHLGRSLNRGVCLPEAARTLNKVNPLQNYRYLCCEFEGGTYDDSCSHLVSNHLPGQISPIPAAPDTDQDARGRDGDPEGHHARLAQPIDRR